MAGGVGPRRSSPATSVQADTDNSRTPPWLHPPLLRAINQYESRGQRLPHSAPACSLLRDASDARRTPLLGAGNRLTGGASNRPNAFLQELSASHRVACHRVSRKSARFVSCSGCSDDSGWTPSPGEWTMLSRARCRSVAVRLVAFSSAWGSPSAVPGRAVSRHGRKSGQADVRRLRSPTRRSVVIWRHAEAEYVRGRSCSPFTIDRVHELRLQLGVLKPETRRSSTTSRADALVIETIELSVARQLEAAGSTSTT